MSDRTVKCPRCKCYRTEDDFLKEGRRLKTCYNCRSYAKNYRIKNKCPHGLQKSRCFDCGGSEICDHNRRKTRCIDCGGSEICLHKRFKYKCINCDGSGICKHKLQRQYCKKCSDSVKVTIQNWIFGSKQSDKKYNRYDADRHIDKCFLKELVRDYPQCYYCEVELQYIKYNDKLATIERLNNKLGHIKSNCVIACRKCNLSRERK